MAKSNAYFQIIVQAIELGLIVAVPAIFILSLFQYSVQVSNWSIGSNWNIGSNWIIASHSVPTSLATGGIAETIKQFLEFFVQDSPIIPICVTASILLLIRKRRNNSPLDYNKVQET